MNEFDFEVKEQFSKTKHLYFLTNSKIFVYTYLLCVYLLILLYHHTASIEMLFSFSSASDQKDLILSKWYLAF